MLFEIVEDIIEIPEEDYKKNEVYRPWTLEETAKPAEQTGANTPDPPPGSGNVVYIPQATARR
jgi:hypothetical protein